jgi:hypothetical protein
MAAKLPGETSQPGTCKDSVSVTVRFNPAAFYLQILVRLLHFLTSVTFHSRFISLSQDEVSPFFSYPSLIHSQFFVTEPQAFAYKGYVI